MDKYSILRKLHERSYARNLHDKIKESLVGSMLSDYSGIPHSNRLETEKIKTPVFHAVVDMLVANLIHNVSANLVDEILDVIKCIEKEQLNETENNHK